MPRRAARKLPAQSLYEQALRLLARRSHTAAELEAKLAKKSRSEEDVSAVLARLRGHGYLDDARVAADHAILRRDGPLLGRRRVLAELRRRGVSEAVAEWAVERVYGEVDESQLARRFLRKKLGSTPAGAAAPDRKAALRLYRALTRAGFGPASILDALHSVSADEELLDQLAEADAVGEP